MIWAFMRLSWATSSAFLTTTRCVACLPMPLAAKSPASTICSTFSSSTGLSENFLQLRRRSSASMTSFMRTSSLVRCLSCLSPWPNVCSR